MKTEDYFILILSHKRAKFLKEKTWSMLDKKGSTAKRVIILSDDDPTIDEYENLFGKENLFIFNKEEAERKFHIDLIDCYHGEHCSRKGAVWARNTQYYVARKLGYRYFMVMDDDYQDVNVRKLLYKKNGKPYLPLVTYLLGKDKDTGMSVFDKVCLNYFDILNSSPWLYLVSFAQTGDYPGGWHTTMVREEYRFKSMNVFFCDTEKEVKFGGRTNEDTNEYVLNGSRGQLSLTLHGPVVSQTTTQSDKEGMTDIYKMFGTYVKSLYTCIQNPSSCRIGVLGNTFPRIHHNIFWKYAVPCVLDDKYCKNKPLDYNSEVMKDKIKSDEDGNILINKRFSYLDNKCEILDNVTLAKSLEDFF